MPSSSRCEGDRFAEPSAGTTEHLVRKFGAVRWLVFRFADQSFLQCPVVVIIVVVLKKVVGINIAERPNST
jgi:hypothetical protein